MSIHVDSSFLRVLLERWQGSIPVIWGYYSSFDIREVDLQHFTALCSSGSCMIFSLQVIVAPTSCFCLQYIYIYIVIPEIMWINSTYQSRSSLQKSLPKSIRTAKRIPKYERLSWQGTYTLKQEMASDIPTSGGMKTFQRTALLLQFFSFMAGIKLSVFT